MAPNPIATLKKGCYTVLFHSIHLSCITENWWNVTIVTVILGKWWNHVKKSAPKNLQKFQLIYKKNLLPDENFMVVMLSSETWWNHIFVRCVMHHRAWQIEWNSTVTDACEAMEINGGDVDKKFPTEPELSWQDVLKVTSTPSKFIEKMDDPIACKLEGLIYSLNMQLCLEETRNLKDTHLTSYFNRSWILLLKWSLNTPIYILIFFAFLTIFWIYF